ncbi:hypothetical protein FA15DRAFT_311055 [Coprinopsis marcescibilis]|uniref:Uncharacterized protein n=1 Tax=Coprinopsis marcescibilis TaxID=230819 RepID=A0A5C3L1P2_COPMA|nr:hypothetical protein FA15DRAFT_311055 [Coprinopsis marcescibilis]
MAVESRPSLATYVRAVKLENKVLSYSGSGWTSQDECLPKVLQAIGQLNRIEHLSLEYIANISIQVVPEPVQGALQSISRSASLHSISLRWCPTSVLALCGPSVVRLELEGVKPVDDQHNGSTDDGLLKPQYTSIQSQGRPQIAAYMLHPGRFDFRNLGELCVSAEMATENRDLATIALWWPRALLPCRLWHIHCHG